MPTAMHFVPDNATRGEMVHDHLDLPTIVDTDKANEYQKHNEKKDHNEKQHSSMDKEYKQLLDKCDAMYKTQLAEAVACTVKKGF